MKKLIMLSVLALTGCGKMTTYELKSVLDKCGGLEYVHELWLDGTLARAICTDGRYVDEREAGK